jgi:hypothetical protein
MPQQVAGGLSYGDLQCSLDISIDLFEIPFERLLRVRRGLASAPQLNEQTTPLGPRFGQPSGFLSGSVSLWVITN